MVYVLLMCALGLAAGILGGLFGIGGGVVVIPALVYLAGMNQKTAQGTTLLMMLPPIGVLAALEYLRRGQADWRAAGWICLGFVLGGYLGARWSGVLSSDALSRGFGVLLLLLGFKLVFKL